MEKIQIITKREKVIIQISREEREVVKSKLPFVHVSHPTRHHKIYMEEHPKALRLIDRLRANAGSRSDRKRG